MHGNGPGDVDKAIYAVSFTEISTGMHGCQQEATGTYSVTIISTKKESCLQVNISYLKVLFYSALIMISYIYIQILKLSICNILFEFHPKIGSLRLTVDFLIDSTCLFTFTCLIVTCPITYPNLQ